MTEYVAEELNTEGMSKEDKADYIRGYIDNHLPKAKAVLADLIDIVRLEQESGGLDEVDYLSLLTDKNLKTFGDVNALMLALALIDAAKKEIQIKKLTESQSHFDDGTLILAALNIDEDEVETSSDVMRVWAQLYSVSHNRAAGEFKGKRIRQIRVDDMLFLVADPPEEMQSGDDFKVITGQGKDGLLAFLDNHSEIPEAIRNTVRGFVERLESKDVDDDPLSVFDENPDFRKEDPIPGLSGVKVYSYGFPRSEVYKDKTDQ